mgnify:CR=1 FL=1
MRQGKDVRGLALKEHILSGLPITILEGTILYGVVDPSARIADLRREGYVIKTRRISYLQALRRINEVAILEPPKNLPLRQIALTEYQLSR